MVAGLNGNVGAGEPVIPVNAKLYAAPTVPPPGVPVKSGGVSVFAGAIVDRERLHRVRRHAVGRGDRDRERTRRRRRTREHTRGRLSVIPPAIVAGLIENVGAGEPVIPVNAKLYAAPTVPPAGVPVKSGGVSVFAGAIIDREHLHRVRRHTIASR